MMVAIVIAVSQGKGGVAKTTTSVNLAGALNELGFPTFLFDWDLIKPDANRWKGKGDYISWIDLVDKKNPLTLIEEAKLKYKFLIFDTPPNFDDFGLQAIWAADYVILPTSTNYLEQENTKVAIEVPLCANKPFKILMSKIKMGTKKGKAIVNFIEQRDLSFKTIITDRAVVADSSEACQWVGDFAKGSDSHKQFLSLAQEIVVWSKEHNLKAEVVL